jgi:hypothetical protein
MNLLMLNNYKDILKNSIIGFSVFFFIIIVFINHIHTTSDNLLYVGKMYSKNLFIKQDSKQFKKNISDNLINKDYVAEDRRCEITGYTGDRHRVRWVKNYFMKNIFLMSKKFNANAPYYLDIILHSLLIFMTLVILQKTFALEKKYTLFFLLYITFVFQGTLSEYSYSIFEMFFLSLAIYASKNKKIFIFLISSLLAVLNRESGFIIILSWLIFNKDFKTILYTTILSIGLLLTLNFDILKCLTNLKFFLPLENQKGQIDVQDLSIINNFSILKVILQNFLLPFGIPLYFYYFTINKNKYLFLILMIYFLTFVFATSLHHMSIRLIILPLILTFMYFYNMNRKINF